MAKKKVKTKAKPKNKGRKKMNTDLQERLKKIKTIREELSKAQESAAKDIMGMLKELMKANPLLVGMRWHQYVPSFNDGDACEFSIAGPDFKFDESINGASLSKKADEDDEDYDSDEGWVDEYEVEDFLKEKTDVLNFEKLADLKVAVKSAEAVFAELSHMETELENMFGQGVQVIVTASGVETEDSDYGN